MVLTAYDKDNNIMGYVSRYVELSWYPKFYEAGSFLLYMLREDYSSDWRYLEDPQGERIAMIESAVYQTGFNGDFVTLSGHMGQQKLNDYLIYPVYTFSPSQDLIVGLQGLMDRETAGDVVIRKDTPCVYENLETQKTGDQIWEWLEDFLMEQGLGSRMSYEEGKWILTVTSGRELDLVFSPRLDTITDMTAELVVGEAYNYALIAGQGEGVDRVTATVNLSKGKPLKKLWVDANDIKQDGQTLRAYKAALVKRGKEKLKEYKKKIKIEGKVLQNRYRYGEDYRLGDTVILDMPGGGSMPAQIIGANLLVKGGETSVTIDLGEVSI